MTSVMTQLICLVWKLLVLKFAKCDFVENGTFILDFQEFLLCKLIYDHSEEYVYVCKDRWLGKCVGGLV